MVWEEGEQLVYREKRHVVQVLTSCIVQANPPEWKREELFEMAFSATSVCLMLLSGKNMQSSSDIHVHSMG